jgi:hypothetical protein
VIPSPVVFCLLPSFLALSCTRSVLALVQHSTASWQTNPYLSCNLPGTPFKLALGVPSRGHSVEQFICSCCWCKRLSRCCENKGLHSRYLAMDAYSSSRERV